MKQISRVALLSDGRTGKIGLEFLELLERKMKEMQKTGGPAVYRVHVDTGKDPFQAMKEYNRIPLEIRPDLLVVADFACIRMKSEDEEPMYNNLHAPVVHLLFQRPWEYEEFMIWRCNFHTRCYCLTEEDRSFIREYYPRLVNYCLFPEGLFVSEGQTMAGGEVSYMGRNPVEIKKAVAELPDYLKTIGTLYDRRKKDNPQESDAFAMKAALAAIGFECSAEEYLNIMYLMKDIIAMNSMKEDRERRTELNLSSCVREEALERFAKELQTVDFPVSLL